MNFDRQPEHLELCLNVCFQTSIASLFWLCSCMADLSRNNKYGKQDKQMFVFEWVLAYVKAGRSSNYVT